MAPWQKAALGESSGTTGGYIVPPEFNQQLLPMAAQVKDDRGAGAAERLFKMMELKVQELSGYFVSSNILLQDAAAGLEKFLMTAVRQGRRLVRGVHLPAGLGRRRVCPDRGRRTASQQQCQQWSAGGGKNLIANRPLVDFLAVWPPPVTIVQLQ